ncbi:MAG: hypothetical protein IKS56_01400 [Lachnospiraceae bacterium]|nr:hypothetical protein [Lachnospiraceae bacterium]
MLGGILKKETCAACRFCCSFRRTSLWEAPVFTYENMLVLKDDPFFDGSDLTVYLEDYTYAKYDLSDKYKTDDPNEEVPCPYLGEKGCTLSEREKPWDCKIWPLRVMNKDGEIVVALTPTCPSINRLDFETVKEFVDTNLKKDIIEYANNHPYLIKEYRSDYPII